MKPIPNVYLWRLRVARVVLMASLAITPVFKYLNGLQRRLCDARLCNPAATMVGNWGTIGLLKLVIIPLCEWFLSVHGNLTNFAGWLMRST